MFQQDRGIWRLAAVPLIALLAFAFWATPGGGGATHAQEDSIAVVEALIEEFNESLPTGDGAAIAAHFTADGSFTNLAAGEGSFGIFGREAIEIAFSGEEPDPQFSVTLVEITAADGQVTGTVEFRDSSTVEAGIERGVADFTALVVSGQVASLDVVDDLSDPQTAQLAEFLASLPDEGDEDEGPPSEDFVEVRMTGDQEGGGGIGSFEGVVFAFVEIEPGPEGVRQPSGIHEGTCEDLGELAQQLAPVWNGEAGSIFSAEFDHLLDEPHAIAVAASPDDTSAVVACADIERAQEPAPTATAAPVLPPVGTGRGSDSGVVLPWLLLGIAALGTAGVAGAALMRWRS